MFSAYKKNTSRYARQILVNLSATLFFAVFGAVYEIFSHEVYSFYMIYAFAVPLLLGVLPFSLLAVLHPDRQRGKKSDRGYFFWNCGILTLATGCAFKGALDIYGTTNRLLLVYPAAGIMLLVTGCVMMLPLHSTARKNQTPERRAFRSFCASFRNE